jgi:hypothetical protein
MSFLCDFVIEIKTNVRPNMKSSVQYRTEYFKRHQIYFSKVDLKTGNCLSQIENCNTVNIFIFKCQSVYHSTVRITLYQLILFKQLCVNYFVSVNSI